MAALSSLVRACESVQVELQGQYSIQRLRQVARHLQTARVHSDLLTLATVPAFPIAVLVLTDIPPLQPVQAGLKHQGFVYLWRVFASATVSFVAFVYQYMGTPVLPTIPPLQIWPYALVLGCSIAGAVYPLASVIGFPLPFTMVTVMPLWIALTTVWVRLMWRWHPMEEHDAAFGRQWLSRYGNVGGALTTVYPFLRYAYTVADARYQLLITLSLPVIKLVFRNLANRVLYAMEDVAPIIVTFGADVFHALFLSFIVQGGNSYRTTAVTMAIDFAQSCVSIYDVHHVLRPVRKINLQGTIKIAPLSSTKNERTNMIEAAVAILDANPELPKRCPSISQPRHLRPKPPQLPSNRVRPTRVADGPSMPPQEGPGLTPQDREHEAFVRPVLKLLYMVEFYMLIEYTEFIAALIYGTCSGETLPLSAQMPLPAVACLTAMTQLPNRRFYRQLQDMTDEQLAETIQNVLTYGRLELLSFIILGIVLSRMLGFSAFRVLTFAIQSKWRIVCAQLTMVVYFMIHLSLEHFGCDCSFQFKWLRRTT